MENARNKEQVYDEDINPLMAKILAVCKEHKIAMVASFALPIDGDKHLRCTSALLDDDHLTDLDKAAKNDYLGALSMLRDGFVAWSRRHL